MLAETSSIAASIEIMSVNYKLSHFLNLYIIYKKFFLFFVFCFNDVKYSNLFSSCKPLKIIFLFNFLNPLS